MSLKMSGKYLQVSTTGLKLKLTENPGHVAEYSSKYLVYAGETPGDADFWVAWARIQATAQNLDCYQLS